VRGPKLESTDRGRVCRRQAGAVLSIWALLSYSQIFVDLYKPADLVFGSGGDSPPLLCSGETPAGVLCPALGFPAQKRCGSVTAGPEKGHENDPRAGSPLL